MCDLLNIYRMPVFLPRRPNHFLSRISFYWIFSTYPNRLFQISRLTLLNVTTSLTVSFRPSHVWSKFTRFGFNDISTHFQHFLSQYSLLFVFPAQRHNGKNNEIQWGKYPERLLQVSVKWSNLCRLIFMRTKQYFYSIFVLQFGHCHGARIV